MAAPHRCKVSDGRTSQEGDHTTVINSVEQVGQHLPDADEPETVSHVGKLDELETLSVQKSKIWRRTAVDHGKGVILGWVLGDHSA